MKRKFPNFYIADDLLVYIGEFLQLKYLSDLTNLQRVSHQWNRCLKRWIQNIRWVHVPAFFLKLFLAEIWPFCKGLSLNLYGSNRKFIPNSKVERLRLRGNRIPFLNVNSTFPNVDELNLFMCIPQITSQNKITKLKIRNVMIPEFTLFPNLIHLHIVIVTRDTYVKLQDSHVQYLTLSSKLCENKEIFHSFILNSVFPISLRQIIIRGIPKFYLPEIGIFLQFEE